MAGVAVLAGGAAMVLVSPDNPLTRAFQAKVSAGDEQVITGPYPLDDDMAMLRRGGVTTLVSLLDPKIPYEAVLLARERDAAVRHRLKLLQFPIASVLGQSLGSENERQRQVDAAARAIASAGPGKVYLHCYLGIHRTKLVADRLRQEGLRSGAYSVRQGERSDQTRTLDRAQAAFEAGRYEEVRQLLRPGPQLEPKAAILLGWANYRLGNLAAAQTIFEDAARRAPDLSDAHNGQGFCALQLGDLTTAEAQFNSVLADNPKDPTALEGLSLLRKREAGANGAAR